MILLRKYYHCFLSIWKWLIAGDSTFKKYLEIQNYDDEIKDLLTDGHTKLLKGFKSKQGKNFDAIVAFDGEYNTTFVFPEKKCKSSYPKKRK